LDGEVARDPPELGLEAKREPDGVLSMAPTNA